MKKLNKKGFTLVELLAVIVVLALLMVVAASSIGTALTNAKKNTLKTEAQKIITNVYQNAYSQYMLSGDISTLAGYTNVSTITESSVKKGYQISGTDGDYGFKVNVDLKGNVTAFCVNYNTSELNIKQTGITSTGAYTIEVKTGKAVITENATCSINAAKLDGTTS